MASPGIVIIRTSAVEVSIQAVSPRSNPAAKAGVACHGSRIDRQAAIGRTLGMTRPPVERFLPVVTASHVPNPVSMLHCGNAAESASNSDRRRGDLPNRWADLFRQWQDVATPSRPSPIKAQTFGLQGEGELETRASSSPAPCGPTGPRADGGGLGLWHGHISGELPAVLLFCPSPPFRGRAMSFGFSDLSVAVIPAPAGIQGRVTGLGALDSRFRGNDRGEKGNSLAKCDCPRRRRGRRNRAVGHFHKMCPPDSPNPPPAKGRENS